MRTHAGLVLERIHMLRDSRVAPPAEGTQRHVSARRHSMAAVHAPADEGFKPKRADVRGVQRMQLGLQALHLSTVAESRGRSGTRLRAMHRGGLRHPHLGLQSGHVT